MLQVGFGRACITPKEPVCLAGGGHPRRIFTSILEDIYVTCVAVTDDAGVTALMLVQDLVSSGDPYMTPTRQSVSDATGVPFDHIFLSSTHTHSAPTPYPNGVGNETFMKLYGPAVIRAAEEALSDRAPATVSCGETQASGLVFVRRYKLADGTYEGASGNTSTCKELIAHAYDSDETVQMIRFSRTGKQDILLTNLGAHATFNGATSKTDLSADFPGAVREYLETNTDCLVAHFISAAGDQTPTTRMKTDDHGLDYRQYGHRVGQIILEALKTLTPVKTDRIQVKNGTSEVPTNRQNLHRLEDAEAVWLYFQETDFKTANPFAHEKGFASIYEAQSIMRHATLPDTKEIGVSVMTLGEIAFAFASYEMYSDNGAWIRENAGYPMTFVATCSNGSNGYLPSDLGYRINCYEAYASNVGRGAGEQVAQLFVQLLNDLKTR